MQEEVNQKTVALSIRTTKLTGKVLAAALGKVVRALQKHHQKHFGKAIRHPLVELQKLSVDISYLQECFEDNEPHTIHNPHTVLG